MSSNKRLNLQQLNSKNKHLFDENRIIIDVWASNLNEEIDRISRDIIDAYPNIAMDTEFPGVVARPLGNFKSSGDFMYQTLKCNVDILNIIQLGLTFSDDEGNLPYGVCTWQFNFKFNLDEDMYAQDSIDLLHKSGIDFNKHYKLGIDPPAFAELLMTSGIILDDEVRWISFHSSYDYGYLLKVLTLQLLPKEESQFFELLNIYFPNLYDIKYMIISLDNLRGGLQKLAEDFGIERIGPQHQAGSDSLLTAAIFFEIKRQYFPQIFEDDTKFSGHLYGIGKDLNREADDKIKNNGISDGANMQVDQSEYNYQLQ